MALDITAGAKIKHNPRRSGHRDRIRRHGYGTNPMNSAAVVTSLNE